MPQKPKATKMSLFDFQGGNQEETLPTRSMGLERQPMHRRGDDDRIGRGDSEGTWRRGGGDEGRSGSRERGDVGRGDMDDDWRSSARLRPSNSREGFGDRREGFGDRRSDPADEDDNWRAGPRPNLEHQRSRSPGGLRTNDSGLTPFRQQLRERAEAERLRRQGDRSTERDSQDGERGRGLEDAFSRPSSRGFGARGEPRSSSREDTSRGLDRADADDNWRASAAPPRSSGAAPPWRRPGTAEEPRSSEAAAAAPPWRRPGTAGAAPSSDWKTELANRNRAPAAAASTEEPRSSRAWVPPSRAEALREDRPRRDDAFGNRRSDEPLRRGDSFRRDEPPRRDFGSRAEGLRRSDEPLRREEPTRSAAPWRRPAADREEPSSRTEPAAAAATLKSRDAERKEVEKTTRELETMAAPTDEWADEEDEEEEGEETVEQEEAPVVVDTARVDKFLNAYQKHVDNASKKNEHMAAKMPQNLGVPEMQSMYLIDGILKALVTKAATLTSLDECLELFQRHAPIFTALVDSNRQTRGYCFQFLTSSQRTVESLKCPRLAKDCTLIEAVWFSLYYIDAVTAQLINFWSDEYSGPEADTADRTRIVFQTQAFRDWLNAASDDGEATKDNTEEDDDEWASSSSDDEDIEALIPKRATDMRVR
ncbi:hypothetical protein FOL47_005629 [Perkinsus chesapeaki]|uniref:W2 domain-containing protein n=1 Tax=Perkinsus chesapeaki TaxID=330153 RepID=A0A7J6MYG8_PERCH|nr:hypothetical protein FOL47_005629 [Perkinsus chesapeaki]